jgi:hypothetical protein
LVLKSTAAAGFTTPDHVTIAAIAMDKTVAPNLRRERIMCFEPPYLSGA